MNKDELTITYRDIPITYNEEHDKWRFTLRGKDRSADTLANAKKAIDAPPPKEEKAFQRFEAWHRNYGGTQKVTVTSMTETGRFWISYPGRPMSGGSRERAQAGHYELYPCNAENDAVIARLNAKKAESEKIYKEMEEIQKELRHVEPKDWELKDTHQKVPAK